MDLVSPSALRALIARWASVAATEARKARGILNSDRRLQKSLSRCAGSGAAGSLGRLGIVLAESYPAKQERRGGPPSKPSSRAVPSRPAHNPWFVGTNMVIPTLIGVVDTTIAGRLVSRGIDWLVVPGPLVVQEPITVRPRFPRDSARVLDGDSKSPLGGKRHRRSPCL
jgi:hypothetical protein